MKNFTSFLKEEDGMGTVEVVLIIVVLIMLVALFKEKIKALAEKLLKKVSDNDETRYNAYLTVYLSLIFGIVLSLLFVLIEGAATGAVRMQAELVADLGIDSVFAEYNRALLNQYQLFFIDSSYGSKKWRNWHGGGAFVRLYEP